ncbi:MAG: cytochrome c biogenesis CcdA family protein [Methylovirgula sp.]|jgi:cytochrome c biogenesis protein CcdA
MTTYLFAFIAGALSILSPCVLPLVPIVLGTAAAEHKLGPVALAIGLAVSFVAIGLFVATIGFAIGVDGDKFRTASAVMLLIVGLVLMVPPAQTWLAAHSGPISDWSHRTFGGLSTAGLAGQFAVGLLLGAAWSPCTGPTLGAASLLAAQGKDLGSVALTMLIFGIGAALPMLLLGFMSRELLVRVRDRMIGFGKGAKFALGASLALVAIAIITGFDRTLETSLTALMPPSLAALSTRF